MRVALLGLVGGILLTVSSSWAGDFEGVIVLREIANGTSSEQQWFLKGDRLRFEEGGSDGEKGTMIFDVKKSVFYSLQHDEKIFLEISTDQASTGMHDAADDMVVTKTGRSERVAGYTCELYHAKSRSDGGSSELCIARGIGNAALFKVANSRDGGSSIFPGWMREMYKDGGFPIKGVDRDDRGEEESRWEAVKIEKKRLDDRMFLPPPDYKKQDLAVMMNGMRGAGEGSQSPSARGEKERGETDDAPDMDALMKQFGEAMKHGQPEGGR